MSAMVSGFGALAMGIPPAVIGAIGAATGTLLLKITEINLFSINDSILKFYKMPKGARH